ncbi:hypothetical protein BD560DRAFT_413564 [Blakeslea trispora]|nr:hypothetical protein BD560DRAFT_413564 [Blakeslea trispora]
MKTGAESRTRLERKSGEPKSRVNTASFQTMTRRSSRLASARKKSDIIEIDSEDEKARLNRSHETGKPPAPLLTKRRRLVHRDPEEDTDMLEAEPTEDQSGSLSISLRRKTASSPINPNQFKPTKNSLEQETSGEGLLKKTLACASELVKHMLPNSTQEMDEEEEEEEEEEVAGKEYDLPSIASMPGLPYDPIDDYQVVITGADEHLLTYPFKGKKSVTVYERDLDRLNDETYLNDTLIDVFPKIWSDEFSRASIYTFSSFFYTRLAGPYQDIHYDTVKRWTSHVDIFDKKFLIIPVAQHNHWFVIVVANPGYCIRDNRAEDTIDDDEVPIEQEDSVQQYIRRLKKRIIYPGTPLDSRKPYIFTLDPLNLTKGSVARMISQYLKKEAWTKRQVEPTDFIDPEIVMTPCPGQKNFTDCGVFCLHYMKSLYQFPDSMMKTLYVSLFCFS